MKSRALASIVGTIAAFLLQSHCVADSGVGDRLSLSITNKYGDVLTNLTVAKILPDGLLLQQASAQIKVKLSELPETLKRKYEPLAAAAAEKERRDLEAEKVFAAGLKQGIKDIAQARLKRDQQRTAQSSTQSGDLSIEIPNRGWKINVYNPRLQKIDSQSRPEQFMYRAYSSDGLNLSIFVEKPAGNGMNHQDVYAYYWAKASRNPLLDENSVKVESAENFVKVSYSTVGIANESFCFAFKGEWVDVHISGDSKFFAEFERELSYR